MMYTNTAMTLFNHYLNDHQEDCYQKVILNQVFWNNDEGANVIKMGLEAGKIDKGRYDRYCKIYQDLKEKEERKW